MSKDRAKWLPHYPEPEPGEWISYDCGKDNKGWHLTVGGLFHADVFRAAHSWSVTLNMHVIAQGDDVEELKRIAERHIVARVQKIGPAYRAIRGRLRVAGTDFQDN